MKIREVFRFEEGKDFSGIGFVVDEIFEDN
jgi:hypothetical protein